MGDRESSAPLFEQMCGVKVQNTRVRASQVANSLVAESHECCHECCNGLGRAAPTVGRQRHATARLDRTVTGQLRQRQGAQSAEG